MEDGSRYNIHQIPVCDCKNDEIYMTDAQPLKRPLLKSTKAHQFELNDLIKDFSNTLPNIA